MVNDEPSTGEARRLLRRAGRWVIGLFWLVQFLELTVVALLQGAWFALHRLPERIFLVGLGMLLTQALLEFAARLEGRPFRTRYVAIVVAALCLCLILVGASYATAKLGFGAVRPFDAVNLIYNGFTWSWFFLSVAAAILALSYSHEAREQEKRSAALEVAARDARIAVLRYQLNPHFLFNTLNSVVALIDEGRHRAAEDMVESLSEFLRATLELDPIDDITLEREFELQGLYLSIEQARFPRRLRACQELPAEARRALVPALITQPLVENAVRHAVARSPDLVSISLSAVRDGDQLMVVVENDGGRQAGRANPGTGIGLMNVRSRLQARFGVAQSVAVQARSDGGFRVELRMPLRTAP